MFIPKIQNIIIFYSTNVPLLLFQKHYSFTQINFKYHVNSFKINRFLSAP